MRIRIVTGKSVRELNTRANKELRKIGPKLMDVKFTEDMGSIVLVYDETGTIHQYVKDVQTDLPVSKVQKTSKKDVFGFRS